MKVLCFALTLLIGTSLLAQRHGHGPKRGGMDIDALKAQIELSTEQETQIKAIQEKYQKELNTLRETEMADRTEKRTAMKELMKAQRDEIQSVLTDEQKATLKANREAHREAWKQYGQERQRVHQEIRAYHEENVKPVLLEQRVKLEAKISAEDRATKTS